MRETAGVVFDGVVLAGGASRRFGGEDKTAAVVAGRTLLDRAVLALSDARTVVVVGPRPPGGREVVLVREDPPGSGPGAGLLAALPVLTSDVVVVLAADLPRVDEQVVAALVATLDAAGPDIDAVVPQDAHGRPQWLLAAYRAGPLRRAARAPRGVPDGRGGPARGVVDDPGDAPRGPSMRELVSGLRTVVPPDWHDYGRLGDVDTPEDLARAQLDGWTRLLVRELGLQEQVGDDVAGLVGTLLDVARDAAHTVTRPAAPVTTFLLGLAAGAALAETSATSTTATTTTVSTAPGTGTSGTSAPGLDLDDLRDRVTALLRAHEGA